MQNDTSLSIECGVFECMIRANSQGVGPLKDCRVKLVL